MTPKNCKRKNIFYSTLVCDPRENPLPLHNLKMAASMTCYIHLSRRHNQKYWLHLLNLILANVVAAAFFALSQIVPV